MKAHLPILSRVAALLLATASLATAGNVTFRVLDQNGVGYLPGVFAGTGGSILFLGTGTPRIASGQSLSIAPGTYTVRIQLAPGLYRDLPNVNITSTTTQMDFLWESRDVTLSVVDQNGVLLPGLEPQVVYFPSAVNGSTARLPINDPSFYPGLFAGGATANYRFDASLYSGQLLRHIFGNVVGPATTELRHEWKTATMTFRLVDQNGVDIVSNAARISVSWIGGGTSPQVLTLPVNDSAVYPDLNTGVPFVDHYEWTADTFVTGLHRGWHRWMATPGQLLKVVPGMTSFTVTWQMQDVVLRAVDQSGAPFPSINGERVPDRTVGVVTWPYPIVADGGTLRLPVNSPGVYPSLFGGGWVGNEDVADGYDLRIRFDANFTNTGMYQNGFFVTPTTTQFDVPWITASGPLFVVDSNGVSVPGSTFQINNTTGGGDILRAAGDTVTLAVTDNATYPNLAGGFTNGYPITVTPGNAAASSTYSFEVMPDGSLLPATFTVGGQTYGLRFRFNTPPVADAGNNLTVFGQSLATTVLLGQAFDVDGDALSFRWLDGLGVELAASQPVGPLGEANLALSTLPSLGVGAHTFVLEVSDGQEITTGSMTLFVDNSPPIATVGGIVNTEEGDKVLLTGTVSDFDGDVLNYSWSEIGVGLVSGSITTLSGGAPVAVPSYQISQGLALGSHALDLTVSDGVNADVVSTLTVNVFDDDADDGDDDNGDGFEDDEAPRMEPVASPSVLWPLNDQMVPVTIQLNATDLTGPIAYDVEVKVSRNAKKNSSGNTLPNYTTPVIDPVQGTVTLMLRASESKKGKGYKYKIKIKATDALGNEASSHIEIRSPKGRD